VDSQPARRGRGREVNIMRRVLSAVPAGSRGHDARASCPRTLGGAGIRPRPALPIKPVELQPRRGGGGNPRSVMRFQPGLTRLPAVPGWQVWMAQRPTAVAAEPLQSGKMQVSASHRREESDRSADLRLGGVEPAVSRPDWCRQIAHRRHDESQKTWSVEDCEPTGSGPMASSVA
jgi:hypothetical protein